MTQSALQGRAYVQNAAGAWVPAGTAPGNGALPVVLTSPNAQAAGIFATLNAYGGQRVSVEPTAVFTDTFDLALDTVLRWTTAGTAPSIVSGQTSINAGAVASASSRAISRPTFASPGLGFIVWAAVVTVDAAAVANTYRFWGWGTETGAPAYQAPGVTTSTANSDAVGFELDSAGALYAVVYASGALKYRSAAISPTLYAGGTQHRYAIFRRADILFWYVEGQETPVAQVSYVGPNVQGLPVRFGDYNSATAPAAHTFLAEAVTVVDSTAQNLTLSDPTNPFQRAAVSPAGALQVVEQRNGSTRSAIAITATGVAGVTSEALVTLNLSRANAATAAVSTFGALTGKTLRLISATFSVRAGAASVAQWARFTIRVASPGPATATSPPVFVVEVAPPAQVAGLVDTFTVTFPDGYDLAYPAQFGVSHISAATTTVESVTLSGFEY